MMGTPRLLMDGEDYLTNKQRPESEKLYIMKCYLEMISTIKTDWLLNLLCEYDWRNRLPPIGEAFWYAKLKEIIFNGDLYMGLIKIPNYAFPDKNRHENFSMLRTTGLIISEADEGYSDGIFSMGTKSITLTRVYMSDSETPNPAIDTIELEGVNGYIEFGTNSLCKSVEYLLRGDCLLRVPYGNNLKLDNPVCAIFKRKNKLNVSGHD